MANKPVETEFDSFKYSFKNGSYFKESIFFFGEHEILKSEVPMEALRQLHPELKKSKKPKQVGSKNAAPVGQMRPGPSQNATTSRRPAINVRPKLQPMASDVQLQLDSSSSHSMSASSSAASAKNLPTKIAKKPTTLSKRPLERNLGTKGGKIDASLSSPTAKRNLSTSKSSGLFDEAVSLAELSKQLEVSSSDNDDAPSTSTTSTTNARLREGVDYSFHLPDRPGVPITDENRERVRAFKKRGDEGYNVMVHAAKSLQEFEDVLSRLKIVEKPANARINAPLGVLDLADVLTCQLPFIQARDVVNFCVKRDVILLNGDKFIFSDSDRKPYFNEHAECAYCKAHSVFASAVDRDGATHTCPYHTCSCVRCYFMGLMAKGNGSVTS